MPIHPYLFFSGTCREAMTRYHEVLGGQLGIFDALAEGGQVSMPLGETFWSPRFGMCTDRFGTSWMVSVQGEEAQG